MTSHALRGSRNAINRGRVLKCNHLHLLHQWQSFGVAWMTVMAKLRTCSFNCQGWNNGLHTLSHFIDSLDLCFLQEHWLLRDQLHLINNISPDFLSVSVCGMDNSELVCAA